MLHYAGSEVRGGDLFQNKNVFSIAKNSIQRNFKGVSNVYTQHKSLLSTTVQNLCRGGLREQQYPFIPQQHSPSTNAKPNDVLVFMVGGTTYEEGRDMMTLMSENPGQNIVLGGTHQRGNDQLLSEPAEVERQLRGHGELMAKLRGVPKMDPGEIGS